MERPENIERKSKEPGPRPLCAKTAPTGSRSEQAKNDDAAKWVAASSTRLAHDHGTTAIAPFSSMVPDENKVRLSWFPLKGELLPIPQGNAIDIRHKSKQHTTMMQISKLPFEIQDKIFEMGTSMIVYAINVPREDVALYVRHNSESYTSISSNEQMVRDIAESCPLAYTCRRSRAAVFRRLHRLAHKQRPVIRFAILEDIHITIRKGQTFATGTTANPRPSYLEASRGSDDPSQYGGASDVVKWVAMVRRLTGSIPATPFAPEIPSTSAVENKSPPEAYHSVFHDHDALSIAPFASMVPTPWGHPDAMRKTHLPRRTAGSPDYDPPLIPVPEALDVTNTQRLPEPEMKMIQISKLPFEIQNAIFELGTSMLLYAINMDERDAEACCYQDRRSFGPPQDKFLTSDEVVTEIGNSCPLAYTCRRSRAAVYKTLHRLMQASVESSNRAPNAGISILKYIHVTVRIGNLVAKEAMKRESESPPEKQCRNPEGKHGGDAMYCNCPRCEGSIETGLDRIVGLRSRWLYDNPLIIVTDVRSRCAEIPHYLMEYVDRIDTEWWFNRHKNACVALDVLRTSFGMMFYEARHLTITPCMPLMSAA
ncbi:hypothetical protein GQ607_013145 [Colletotrichum asianum]|uniref:Uncharacterized protein n=1 Tax=Colletotrichum asianum TaxID=702518 RepID=A0A8H3W4D2_9PEZI|nr:hypothetical protein GQ607_013145 [Colletotrichum asianum]